MAYYDGLFEALGLRDWCGGGAAQDGPMTMAQLLAKSRGGGEDEVVAIVPWWQIPFPSLDTLNASCQAIWRTRDLTAWVADGFLAIKNTLKIVLDPLTQPLSWLLDGALWAMLAVPWWVVVVAVLAAVGFLTRSATLTASVCLSLLFLAFIDHFDYAMQTLSIIFVCTTICVLLGVPIGIAMSKREGFQRSMVPLLDMLQTLPTFVYLIPLIFLFSVTESKLYGIAIILYAIVPVIRLTDLGIRLVDKDVLEAADAFGMTPRQRLFGVEVPLALPNIMAGINQTIMMALAMVVIASLVSAPGLGVLVLRGIRNLELGVGLIAGFCIVILAVILDRVSKAAVGRISSLTPG